MKQPSEAEKEKRREWAKMQVAHWPDDYARTLAVHAIVSEGEWRPWETEKERARLWMVWNADQQLVGVMGWHVEPNAVIVDQLATNQGKGEGTHLMRLIALEAEKRHLPIWLAPSPNAEGFYERFGFKSIDRPEYEDRWVELDVEGVKRFLEVG